MEFSTLLNHLITLSRSAKPCPGTFDLWYTETQKAWSFCSQSGGRALLAGAVSDRLGFAFAGGYCAALQNLMEDPSLTVSAVCITEAGGNRPADIHTTLTQEGENWVLNGEKSFVTLADHAEWLWVAAHTGEVEGRKNIKMLGLPVNQTGVEVTLLPDLPFVPEISHALVKFNNVVVKPSDILHGDGYKLFIKPFRTVEDIHVCAATCGLLLKKSIKNQWPRAVTEQLMAQAFAWMELSKQSPRAYATHLALAGLMTQQRQLSETLARHIMPDTPFDLLWQRDKPLLGIAEKVRHLRTERAWQQAFSAPVAVN